MTRYVIIGAGAIGVTFAAELQRAGRDIVLVARGGQLDALRAGKLHYVRPDGSRYLDLPTAGGPAEVNLTPDDVLVLATKTQDAEDAIAAWAWRPVGGGPRSAAASLPVITLQNGLDAERTALRRFRTVFGAVLWVAASYVQDGEVAAAGGPAPGAMWLGAYPDGPHPGLAAIAADLRAATFEVQVVEDLSRWKAAKLLASATFVLDALYQPGELRDRAAGLLREEATEILTASGLGIADMNAESSVDLDRVRTRPASRRRHPGNSSWQSLTRAGSLETDFLNGEIVLAARLAGRSAPGHEAVLERMHRARREDTAARSLSDDDLLTVLPQLGAVAAGSPAR
jgi:thiosulfate/3-mercaptopyruvate sulfurtransferase